VTMVIISSNSVDQTTMTLSDLTNISTPVTQRKEPRRKELRPSRHRGLLELKRTVQVYDMRSASSETIADIINTTRASLPIFKTNMIFTRGLHIRDDCSCLCDLELIIYNSIGNDSQEKKSESITVIISMPQKWTPRMYLAVINRSINEHNVLTMEKVSGLGFSINEAHNFFCSDIESLHESLSLDASFFRVTGGELVS
jgi:hypothetical protein